LAIKLPLDEALRFLEADPSSSEVRLLLLECLRDSLEEKEDELMFGLLFGVDSSENESDKDESSSKVTTFEKCVSRRDAKDFDLFGEKRVGLIKMLIWNSVKSSLPCPNR
jgi:hypothetical protein